MLAWHELTTRQRTVCILLSMLIVAGITTEMASNLKSPATILEGIAVLLLFASVLLNPNFVRVNLNSASGYMKQFLGKPFPAPCKWLAFAALGTFALSRVANAVL